MKELLAIGGFGALGVLVRYGVSLWALKHFPSPFPWATLLINIVGSFLIGLLYGIGVERHLISPEWRNVLTVGLLGGFTTFSAYSLESLRLWDAGEIMLTILYYFGSPTLAVLACYAGLILSRVSERI